MRKGAEEVEVKGWGIGAKFSGPQVTCVVVLLLLGAFLGYAIYQHNADAHESLTAVVHAQEAVKDELKQNREVQEAMMYILSLTQAEREKLNLTKPKKLQDMQR